MSNQLQCNDILQLPGVDGPSTCNDISTFAEYCGCPNNDEDNEVAVPNPTTMFQFGRPCTFCPYGDDPLFTNKVILEGDDNGNDELTCSIVHNNIAQPEFSPSCYEARQQLENAVGTNIYDYCGCSPEPIAVKPCPTCPDPGYELNVADPTCTEWAMQLKTIPFENQLCDVLQNSANIECCISLYDDEQEVGTTSTTTSTDVISAMNQYESSASSVVSLVMTKVLISLFGIVMAFQILIY